MSNETFYNLNDFNIEKFKVNPITKEMKLAQKKRNANLFSTFINYDDVKGKVCFECKDIKLVSFSGIPKFNQKFHKTGENDPQRYKIQINLDMEQQSCKELYNIFSQIDEYIVNDIGNIITECKNDNDVKKYQFNYSHLIKYPKEDDDVDETKKKFTKYNRIELKIPYDIENKSINTDLCKICMYDKNTGNGKIIKNIKTITQLAEFMPKNSIICPTFYFQKFWYNDNKCGVSVVCTRIIIIERGTTVSKLLPSNRCKIIDDDKTDNTTEATINVSTLESPNEQYDNNETNSGPTSETMDDIIDDENPISNEETNSDEHYLEEEQEETEDYQEPPPQPKPKIQQQIKTAPKATPKVVPKAAPKVASKAAPKPQPKGQQIIKGKKVISQPQPQQPIEPDEDSYDSVNEGEM